MERIRELLAETSIQNLVSVKMAARYLDRRWEMGEALTLLQLDADKIRSASLELFNLITNPLKVYLDDTRATPTGWIRTYWPNEVIDILKLHKVTKLSLDHDLGDDERGTGYMPLVWIEEQMAINGYIGNNFQPPVLNVHSANGPAAAKMNLAIKSIERFK